ncbi:MAG: ATP synthase F1 subunit epsilon [Lachnospiraceae bacterium]|nr:ATP synthase F1 subunit epsilon [Lachnospiraceae bacterium]
MADDGKLLKLRVISPDRVFFEGDADFVELRTSEGEIGVYRAHIPLTSILVPGLLKIHLDGNVRIAALHNGFVEILPDRITVLAESAEWPDEIDVERAENAKKRAEDRLRSGDENVNVARAELALRKALIRIEASSFSQK